MQPDIEEMLGKVRKIRCMHGPRYSVCDKVSKVQIYFDSVLENEPNIFHICWKFKQDGKEVFPQVDFITGGKPYYDFEYSFKPLKDALEFALTEARQGKEYLTKYNLIYPEGKLMPITVQV